MKYEAVIGLEIHVELQTRSKIFCGCSTAFGAEPNTNCCPICLGLPGTLPVLNRRAVEYAVKAALALNCQVQEKSVFARKNYFYPDLTKAYQISQERMPLAWGGYLEVDFPTGSRRIHLQRVHLEEEAGKLVHAGDSILSAAYSLADYNRAGLPLLEIVTAPELHSGQEARLFLEELRLLLLYTGVSDVKMEEGSLRCDANISLRPAGSTGLGVRAEVKNLNSFRAVEQALNYEFERQARILAEGGELFQATCHWDDSRKATVVMRRKEEAADYRYFPEPDLPPLVLERSFIEAIREQLPELPRERRRRLQEQYGLSAEVAALLVEDRELAVFFEAVAVSYHTAPGQSSRDFTACARARARGAAGLLFLSRRCRRDKPPRSQGAPGGDGQKRRLAEEAGAAARPGPDIGPGDAAAAGGAGYCRKPRCRGELPQGEREGAGLPGGEGHGPDPGPRRPAGAQPPFPGKTVGPGFHARPHILWDSRDVPVCPTLFFGDTWEVPFCPTLICSRS